jgi:hypothetical protein
LDHIQPRNDAEDFVETLSQLSRVCQFFYSAISPRIFDTLKHIGYPYSRPQPPPSHPRFCREVVKGKSKEYARSLAKYVRTFRLVNWIDPDTSLSYETAAKFLKECLSAMPYMPNLTTLELSYVAIVPSILRALPNLEQLESLKIIEFAVD